MKENLDRILSNQILADPDSFRSLLESLTFTQGSYPTAVTRSCLFH